MTLNARMTALDGKFDTRMAALDAKFETRFDMLIGRVFEMDNRLGRVEVRLKMG